MARKAKTTTRRRRAPAKKRRTSRRKARGVSLTNLAAAGAAINAMSSIILGKDLKNGFKGQSGATDAAIALAETGEARIDTLSAIAKRDDYNTGSAVQTAVKAITANVKGTATMPGVVRTAGPVAVAVAAKTAVKMSRVNRFIPVSVRRVVRF